MALAANVHDDGELIDRTTIAVLARRDQALDISDAPTAGSPPLSQSLLVATPSPVVDRSGGARRGLVWSVLVWTVVAALHAVVPGFAILFMLRIALWLAEGPTFPGAAQMVQRVLPPADRERGFGVLFTGSSIGGMIAPPLASALYALAGWRVAFVGTAVVGLIWVPVWIYVTRKAKAQLDRPPDVDVARPQRATFRQLIRHSIMLRALCAVFAAAPIAGFSLGWGAKYLHKTFDVSQADIGGYSAARARLRCGCDPVRRSRIAQRRAPARRRSSVRARDPARRRARTLPFATRRVRDGHPGIAMIGAVPRTPLSQRSARERAPRACRSRAA